MKTLKQIKDDYAIQQGFANWYELINYCHVKHLDHYTTEVMKIYAMECLKLAYKNAEFYQDGDLAVLDYDSITNENNIIK